MRMPAAWKNSAISRESGLHLREHELVGDLVLDSEPRGHGPLGLLEPGDLLAHLHGPVEYLPLDRGAALGPGHRARVDLLEDAGHAADEVGSRLGQILPELVDVLGEGRAEPAVDADEGL